MADCGIGSCIRRHGWVYVGDAVPGRTVQILCWVLLQVPVLAWNASSIPRGPSRHACLHLPFPAELPSASPRTAHPQVACNPLAEVGSINPAIPPPSARQRAKGAHVKQVQRRGMFEKGPPKSQHAANDPADPRPDGCAGHCESMGRKRNTSFPQFLHLQSSHRFPVCDTLTAR